MSPLVALAALALLSASAHGKPAFALPQLDLAGDPSLQDHDVPSALLQDPYSYYLGDGQVPSQAYGARPLSAYSTGEVYPLSAYFNEKVHPLSAYSYENAFPLSVYSGEKVIPVGAYSNKEEPFYTQHKLARPLYSGVQVVEVPVQVPVQVPVPVPVPVPVQVPVQVVRRPVPVVARPIHVVHPVHVVRPDRPVYHNVEKPEEATVSVVEEAARPEAVYNETVQQPEEPHPQEITPEVPSEKTIKHEDTTVYHIKEVVQDAPVKEEIQVIEKNVVTQPQETTVYQTTVLPDETVGTYNLDAVSEVPVPSKTVIDTTSGTESVYQTAVASSQQTEQSSTSSGVSQYAASSQGAGSAGLGLQGSTGLRLNAGGLGLGGIGFNAGLNGGLQGGAGLNAGLSGGLGFNAGLNGGVRSGLGLSAGAGGSGGIGFGAGLNGGGLFGANTKGSLFG